MTNPTNNDTGSKEGVSRLLSRPEFQQSCFPQGLGLVFSIFPLV